MVNRRHLLQYSAALSVSLIPFRRSEVFAQNAPAYDVVWPNIEVFDGLIVDHYRVVPGQIPEYGSVVVGAFLNETNEAVDAPSLLKVSVCDAGGGVINSASAQFSYPIIPAGERIGFEVWLTDTLVERIDPKTVVFAPWDQSELSTYTVRALEFETVDLLRWEDVSTSDSNLSIEATVKNTSKDTFEYGIDPRFTVWDADDVYCGNSFATVFTAIGSGEEVNFITNSYAGLNNPLDLAGEGFKVIPRIAPRQ